ncbi:unnamed protein product [Chilo suppressalis]|uniref:Uncharacterized protein n=1 Tax=Chilo suppressalis TaxID=168631 RepID=A0ABN8B4A8_CHISP|nr:hypothetical protein evm_003109 [Chilo suppressalis]CAH0400497.1 unnamed protein product [Chilo suppressalis]
MAICLHQHKETRTFGPNEQVLVITVRGVQRLNELHKSAQLFDLSVLRVDDNCREDHHEQTIHKIKPKKD